MFKATKLGNEKREKRIVLSGGFIAFSERNRADFDIICGMENELIYEEETYAIRGAVYEVYKTLGNGYLEEVYQNALEEELKLRGIPFEAKRNCTSTTKDATADYTHQTSFATGKSSSN